MTISPTRQLEIAKECGGETYHELGPESIDFSLQDFHACIARIEAEVIARMEPVYQMQTVSGNWVAIDEAEYTECKSVEEFTVRILYRLPDSK